MSEEGTMGELRDEIASIIEPYEKSGRYELANNILTVLRPHLGLGVTVWAVNQVYDPHVGHGFEPLAFFSTEAIANAYRDTCEVRQAEDHRVNAEYYKTSTKFEYEFTVEQWTVDDIATLRAIATTPCHRRAGRGWIRNG